MIYKLYLIDSDSGVELLSATFKEFKEKRVEKEIFPGFFNEINKMIDKIHLVMSKNGKVDEMTRIIESEDAIIVIYFHPTSRVLSCSISDADDNIDKLKDIIIKIGKRFWKKHQSDLKVYRTTTEKSKFLSFKADIENLTLGGRIAEIFPKSQVIKNVLEKIHTMGIISEFELHVAIKCDGTNSPLKISRMFGKTRTEINETLRNLQDLDIITM
ncbi:MAG: hypothetical protein BAJALOKI2v1_950007 [Promethearchaeota archaeon]|nr:MAG: hypothetical protein BAJALOKI2v1_950007 [Candidatus Lokiarchaeota archaeon]